MSSLHALVLGIVQGLTEFLPISSTAHLRIVPAVLGWPDPGAAFSAIIQLGTMAAVVLFFREDLIRIAVAWVRSLTGGPEARRSVDARLGWMIGLGTIPVAVFGLIFKGPIENGARDLTLIGIVLIVFAGVLAFADARATQRRGVDSLTARDGAIIGLAQALALVPGVSRSGATMSAGFLLGLDRVAAARYSFLLSIPAVVLSGLFELKGVLDGSTDGPRPGALPIVLATGAAFVVGYASIAGLLRFLTGHSLRGFVAYRVVAGAAVLGLVAAGSIS